MRIGICGAQSVGKTTLLNALRSEDYFKDYSVCNEVTRTVKSWGININEQGNDLTQRLIMMLHLENVTLYKNMLTDRTALDCLVYTRYLLSKSKVSVDTLRHINMLFWKIWGQYDLVIFINPEFPIVEDNVRSTDVEFRDSIQAEFIQVIEELELYKDNLRYVRGSVSQRINQVLALVKEKQNER